MKNHNFVAFAVRMVIAIAASLIVGLVKLVVAISKAPEKVSSASEVYAPIFEEPVKVESLPDPWKPSVTSKVQSVDVGRAALRVSAKRPKNSSLMELIREEAG